MSRKVTVTLKVDDDVSNEQIHEQLCVAVHEGIPAFNINDVGEVQNVPATDSQS